MDNLFAIVLPNNNVCEANPLINEQLIKNYFLNKPCLSSKVINNKNYIYLYKYSNELARVVNNTDTVQQGSIIPIISNSRVDNKKDFADDFNCTNNINLAVARNIDTGEEMGNQTDNPVLLPDEQIILNVYSKYGAESFGKLKGNFQAIFWDENSANFCAAIDPFSSRSLFYINIGSALCVASDAKILAEITQVKLTINKLAISQWLSGRPNPNASMFNEISKLPAGHCLEFNAENELTLTKFWDINPNDSLIYSNTEEYKSHFLNLLKTSVANRLNNPLQNNALLTEQASVFSQMSGGMDSTSITALAKQLLDKQNRPLHTISHQYNNTASCDESSNIADMISKLDLTHAHFIELDKYQASSFAQLYPTDFDSPGIVLSPKYHQELALMKSLGANILLTGNGGDETCWGHSASYRSRLYKGELGVINEVIDACKQLNEPIARSLYTLFAPDSIQNLIKLARKKPIHAVQCPPWLSSAALTIVTNENQSFVNPFSANFNPAKHARYHGLTTTSTYNSMRSYQKVASKYGVNVQHPFFDADIVKFSFAIPEKLLIQGIYPKWLLRQTMQNYLPASVCWDKHKVVFDHHFANLVKNNKLELRKLLSHEGLQDLGLLDNAILLSEFDAVIDNPNGHLNVDMLYAILTQLWFQSHYAN